jgi:acyl-CoA synthetase (AMP-forming)/AMP-acid ligase II
VRSATIVALLRERAHRSPERLTYVFLRDGETEESRLALGDIDRRARAVAAALQRMHARGERALLLHRTSDDFVTAFFGCLYAGVIAVPVPAPGPGRVIRTLPRLRAIAHDAQARLVLTTSRLSALLPALATAAPDLEALRWLTTDTLPVDGADDWIDPHIDTGSIAFLQYTSGSTANPKGAVITHANILHNEAAIQRRFESGENTVAVSWLPLNHDMGLIGSLLGSLYGGGRAILMSPEAFLQRPVRWLHAISRYRADISGGPNFAFDHCVRRITPDQCETLDLSSWSLAFTGAEPVRADTLRRFTQTFAPRGFRADAFYPCYGLAESTLMTTGGARYRAPVVKALRLDALERGLAVDVTERDDADNVRRVVSSGRSIDDQRIAIVDPETGLERHAREVGEICVSSPSVARGYWNRSEETERTFRAQIPGTDELFLRTGDLGFLDDGELFVTGRLKELIVMDGRNHYPQDLEQTAEAADPALQPGACAAFSIEAAGEERLVIVAEMQRPGPGRHNGVDEIARAIRRAVAEVHGLEVHDVRLLRPGGVLKTSSGKLRRLACRDAFLTGMFDVAGGEGNAQPA